MNVDEPILKKYYTYLKFERNFADNSVEAYLSDIHRLMEYIHCQGRGLLDVQQEDVETFMADMVDLGITAKSMNRILSGLRAFYRYLRLNGDREDDPVELISSPRLPQHLPEVLSLEEVNAMVSAPDPATCDGQRNRAILETLYSCGLRVSELTDLRFSNIFEKEGFIRVYGKGRKERIVPIAPSALHEIRLYIAFRYELPVQRGCEDYVFLNRLGRPLSRVMVFNIVKRYAGEAGIQKKISPHTFRHTFATHLLEGGANLRAIQLMLGHESIHTTEIYTKVDQRMLREEILTYHPRNRH